MNTIRKVSIKRARKLKKRYEDVVWSLAQNSYIWCMTHKYRNRWKYDIAKVAV